MWLLMAPVRCVLGATFYFVVAEIVCDTVATSQHSMLIVNAAGGASSAGLRREVWTKPKFGQRPKMLDRTASPTDRITALINRMLSERSLRFPAFPDDDLRSLGLSSLDMVNLVLAVEAEFDVSIPDADITPTRFRSIATIAELVTALQSAYEQAS
jgi:acyl carrier protein